MKKAATISEDGVYRRTLRRCWDDTLPVLLIIGLNPSTADGESEDPTSTRSIAFAKREGCGSLIMENLADYRATSPADMKKAARPVSAENMAAVLKSADEARSSGGKVVCAWGAHGEGLDLEVLGALLKEGHELLCFGVTKSDMPRHPLYLRADTPLHRYVVEWV